MKKAIIGLVLVSLVSFTMVSCGSSGGGGGGTSNNTVIGVIAALTYTWIMTNASVNFSNMVTPITGTAVSGATVTITNETQGASQNLTEQASTGYYSKAVGGSFAAAGDKVNIDITAGNDTITGSPTEVPNPTFTNLAPAGGMLPCALSWEVTYYAPSYEATHALVQVVNSSDPTDNVQKVVPITQTYVNLTSAEVNGGGASYQVMIQGVNSMTLTGAKSGSFIYVAGGAGGGSIVLY